MFTESRDTTLPLLFSSRYPREGPAGRRATLSPTNKVAFLCSLASSHTCGHAERRERSLTRVVSPSACTCCSLLGVDPTGLQRHPRPGSPNYMDAAQFGPKTQVPSTFFSCPDQLTSVTPRRIWGSHGKLGYDIFHSAPPLQSLISSRPLLLVDLVLTVLAVVDGSCRSSAGGQRSYLPLVELPLGIKYSCARGMTFMSSRPHVTGAFPWIA
ncbi:hypothetical protein EYF80_022521 [Liparis tanakae]|uniref:Uncharacterized protein n=1 Tax=Liparis tanakae TaxID=230148 RepID=A0A4Z2HR65_9TELE|nr:hypothetical protein EYF80_022521 [Liparis tanakae]